MPIILGIDYSINCPGLCVYSSEHILHPSHVHFFFNIHHTTKRVHSVIESNEYSNIHPSFQDESITNNIIRYINNARWVIDVCKEYGVTEVCMEGYALHSIGKVFNISEATGILKAELVKHGYPISIYSPPDIKKWFSGKGNADKLKMVSTFNERYQVEFQKIFELQEIDSPITDMVDSFACIYRHIKKEEKNAE